MITLVAALATLLVTSCDDWESGSSANSSRSQKSGDFNLSNVYIGILSGGRAVSRTTRGRITTLTLQQTGSSVIITDNQGSTYKGFVGNGIRQSDNATPTDSGDESDASTNVISTGRSVTTYQLSFSGHDKVAGRDVEFSGVIEVTTQSVFVAGLIITDGQGNVTGREFVEEVLTTYTIKGTWTEVNGHISNVLAQVQVAQNVTDAAPEPEVVPGPEPAPEPEP